MPDIDLSNECELSGGTEPVEKAHELKRAFGKEARLTNQLSLDTVKQNGVKRSGRYSILLILKTPPDAVRRAAFLISRRFDHLAVVRNRARRLYREVFRLLYDELPPMWILFIPKRGIKSVGMQEVLEDTRRQLESIFNDVQG